MKALIRIGIASAVVLCIAGCATPGPPAVPTTTVSPSRTKEIPADRARNAIAIGKSTRAEVIAALGETLVISFDSGFEVWVYRLAQEKIPRAGPEKRAGPVATGEFVVLFAPSGHVAKTRVRPAPTPSHPSPPLEGEGVSYGPIPSSRVVGAGNSLIRSVDSGRSRCNTFANRVPAFLRLG